MTVAQLLKTKEFPLRLYDSNGRITYYEASNKYWYRIEYDSNGNEIYFEDSKKYWSRKGYDSNGNLTYFEDSTKFWYRKEYDSNKNVTYVENSDGNKKGTPRNQSSCAGKVVEIDGKKYKLQEVK